ncbi:CFI-box-CTERM domain-containing protein [Candidatus Nitrososphaera sp. FF02]|uniref:CFI-box-CTERM domain-containing protein n=1 Tax=Candidatus Nitrososphaera sp. FF02 TaxID=3398226 RepID=UPI0039ECB5D3
MKRYLAPLLLATLAFSSFSAAYGHGLGTDQSLPAVIDNRQITVEATISPSYLEGVGTVRPSFMIRTLEPASNSTVAGIDYRIVVEKAGNVLLDQEFRAQDGIVMAALVPEEVDVPEVNGLQDPGRVQVGQSQPAEIKSRILTDGGLYKVSITLQTGSTGLNVAQDRTFDLYVSVSKTQGFEVETPQGMQQMFVTTYYADVSSLEYDQEERAMGFSMPFDWSPEYIAQVPLVHMEVRFPKALEDFQVNSYRGYVNGVELEAGSVLIDDYTFEDLRVVHFVFNNDQLDRIAESAEGQTMSFILAPADRPKFPLDLMSTTEKYLWQLSWGPEVIESGAPTTFVMNIQDPIIGDLVRNSSFDFVVSQYGSEVYRQHMTSGQGTFSLQYAFPEEGTYRVAAQRINGENETAQLDVVVQQGSNTAPVQQPQQPSGCLIATAAFGSELTPQVQFLRGFRDNYILRSQSGAAFMGAFNSVYYSFSPQVADYEREQPWLQTTVKAAVYPLFGVLVASEGAFSAAGGGEAGTIVAGALASSLIGAVYVSPAAVAAFRKKHVSSRLLVVAAMTVVGTLAATLVALYAGAAPALSIATSAFVIASAAAAALAVAKAARMLAKRA